VSLPTGLIATLGTSNGILAQQQRSLSDHVAIPVIGTVNWISGRLISVATDGKVVDVSADERTEVWTGKTFYGLSPVRVGDDVSARCRADDSGRLVAEAIWINIINFFGLITNVDAGGFTMLTNPNADPESAYVQESLRIRGSRHDLQRQRQGRHKVESECPDGWVGSKEWNCKSNEAHRLRKQATSSDG